MDVKELEQLVRFCEEGFFDLSIMFPEKEKEIFEAFKKGAKIPDELKKMVVSAWNETLKPIFDAEQKAVEILAKIEDLPLEEVAMLDPIDALTVLAMVAQTGKKETKAAQEKFDAYTKEKMRKYGKKGAEKSHKPMKNLQAFTIEKYNSYEGTWKSANHAARTLKNEVIGYGKTIKVYLSEENAQRTMAEWIRNYKKSLSSE
ncbi:MAG: hypothetical protein FWD51_02900 [Betaproteobacteria bacterium]|nr:hypothetical protein [Betaproteobacteria bacterium]